MKNSNWVKFIVCLHLSSCVFVNYSYAQVQSYSQWDGPIIGPIAQSKKKVMFISTDFRNSGVSAVYRGFYMAAIKLNWDVLLIDGNENENTIRLAFLEAIKLHQDAIILGGFGVGKYLEVATQAKHSGIFLAGWHAAEKPGSTNELFVNISTEPADVAKIAVEYAISKGNHEAGFVIFNDSRYAIANEKIKYLKDELKKCNHCKLLSIEDIPISDARDRMYDVVKKTNQMFDKKWTHTLAINDVYFDSMNFPLLWIKRPDIVNVSAGDGSRTAIARVISGRSQQIGTVAEPTNLQGWQLADELNRAFSGNPPSGYVSKPILVTASQSRLSSIDEIDSDIPYKAHYKAMWSGSQTMCTSQ